MADRNRGGRPWLTQSSQIPLQLCELHHIGLIVISLCSENATVGLSLIWVLQLAFAKSN
jgi:hypothetical protein